MAGCSRTWATNQVTMVPSTGLPFFFLFLVIHYASLISTTGTGVGRRPCNLYNRCICTNPSNSTLRYPDCAQNLTSQGESFRLGFFGRGSHTYLGIWYTNTSSDQVIVWVANRDSPMPAQSHSTRYYLTIDDDDGNAKVRAYSSNFSYWSTNSATKPSAASNVILQLSDTGNLMLIDRGGRGGTLWQSFEHPTDTFLPGMDFSKIGFSLSSWKSRQDPAQGYYSFQQGEGDKSNKLFIYNLSQSSVVPYWDSTFSFLHPKLTSLVMNNMTGNLSSILRLVMNATGSVQLWELQADTDKWSMLWVAPNDHCDLFDSCGSFGVCDAGNTFSRCKCLPGYEPNDPGKWELEDFSSGCSKRTNDQCGERFLTLPMIKLPPDPDINSESGNETQCRDQCLNACGRRAYSFDPNQSRCLIWTNVLTHIQEEYYNPAAHTLYIRLNHSDIGSGSRTCSICGTNVIPYPLSTEQNCGDPAYFSFQCNTTNGQVYFKPPTGQVYKVSLIDPNSRTFLVQLSTLRTSGTCNDPNIKSKVFNLNNSSPFSVIKCSIAPLIDKQVVDVELSWKPPPPPACNSSADCKDWLETSCAEDADGKKSCICMKGFDWDSQFMNCTKVHDKHLPSSLKAGIATASGVALLLIGSFLFVLHLRRKRARERAGIVYQFNKDDIEDIDIPFVDYQSILSATDNFSDANKLGVGGFGPVYKGKFVDEKEVAVKRLSATSVQGIEEFRNEVILIAKLQHRNLVRVLGYCIKEEEKILIYEYMPNKSLSSFIFDQSVSPLLDWMKRFNIILGIARGLLYLHQDSRLRIIHRDLKPSNILLDEELNPKISDFGLARIVAGNEMATSTARVVGTYGYMSPEYALDGYFSIKSDVYSFGIVVLEVISGRRCTSLFQFENSLISLLGYAWTLWDKEEALELVDSSILDSCDSSEVKRCINVALLCVQEDPSERPTMSTVLLMLGGGDNMSLPYPNQPMFVARKPPSETAPSSSKLATSDSNVELTTSVEGR